jgi:hypothetical protein
MQITVGQGTHIARRLSDRCVDARILTEYVVFAWMLKGLNLSETL